MNELKAILAEARALFERQEQEKMDRMQWEITLLRAFLRKEKENA